MSAWKWMNSLQRGSSIVMLRPRHLRLGSWGSSWRGVLRAGIFILHFR